MQKQQAILKGVPRIAAAVCLLLAIGPVAAQPPAPPMGGLDAWAEPLYATLIGTNFDNYAIAQQAGSLHTLSIDQATDALGQSNLVIASQQGVNNELTVKQITGGGNIAQIEQFSSDNVAFIEQSFSDVATVSQNGSNNTVSIIESGGNNSVTARQNNNNNSLTVNAPGNFSFAITQSGNQSVVVNGMP